MPDQEMPTTNPDQTKEVKDQEPHEKVVLTKDKVVHQEEDELPDES